MERVILSNGLWSYMVLLQANKALFFNYLLSICTQDKVKELFCKTFRLTGGNEV